jgi:hypothetical protein
MATRVNETAQALLDELRRHGLRGRTVRRAKHPAIVFDHQGVTYVQVFAGTPSDVRGLLNARSQLRRRLRELRASD